MKLYASFRLGIGF